MIKSNELRIGNWVNIFRTPKDKSMSPFKIEEIYKWDMDDKYYVIVDSTFSVNIDTGIEPIPLTEEMLLKCGFEQLSIGDGYNYILSINGFGWSVNLKSNDVGFDFLEYQSITKVKHLHQLQNLYHSLTGEELEIKL